MAALTPYDSLFVIGAPLEGVGKGGLTGILVEGHLEVEALAKSNSTFSVDPDKREMSLANEREVGTNKHPLSWPLIEVPLRI